MKDYPCDINNLKSGDRFLIIFQSPLNYTYIELTEKPKDNHFSDRWYYKIIKSNRMNVMPNPSIMSIWLKRDDGVRVHKINKDDDIMVYLL